MLVLLPIFSSKLLAQWQGPYKIVKHMGEINYIVDMHDWRNGNSCSMSTCYVSGMPHQAVLYISIEVLDEEQDIPTWSDSHNTQSKGQPTFGNNLTQSQLEDLMQLLEGFSDVISNTPGRTDLVKHHVLTRDVHPV